MYETAVVPRTSLQLLRDRNLGILFWGKLTSMIAVWAFTIVTVTVAFEETRSATWVGAVSAAGLAPQFLLALYAGRLADKYGPMLPIVTGVVISGLSSLTLAGRLEFSGRLGGPVEPLFLTASALAFGVGLALSAPAMHSVVPRLVKPAELSAAVALNFVPTALARTLGPALGAAAATVLGPSGALAAIATLCLAAAVGFAFASTPSAVAAPDGARDQRVGAALRYVVRERAILGPLMGVAVLGAGAEPAITLAPVLTDAVAGTADGTGVVVSAFGAGGVLGVLAHTWLNRYFEPMTEGLIATTLLAVGVALTPAAPSLALIAVAMLVAGCATLLGVISYSVAVQQRCRSDMMGRVMALWVLAFAGARPVAGIVLGVSSEALGTTVTLLGTSLAVLTGAVAVRASVGGLRRRGMKDAA